MSTPAVNIPIPDDFIDTLAQRVAELVGDHNTSQKDVDHWMDVDGVAAHLCTSTNAIRGMVKRRQIPCHRTPTGRLLFDRQEIDSWVRSERDATT